VGHSLHLRPSCVAQNGVYEGHLFANKAGACGALRGSSSLTLRGLLSRQQGWSLRRIAGRLGISHMQASRDAEGVTNVTPATVTGSDGKEYPARRDTAGGENSPPDNSDTSHVVGADGKQYPAGRGG
jgi:hypothetical protein